MQLKKIRKMLNYNLKTLVGFELIYKLVTTIIFVPLFLGMFRLTLTVSGLSYLTFENVIKFLTNPLVILLLLLLIIFMTFYTLIDISTIVIILDKSYQEQKIRIKEAFLLAIQKSKLVFKKKNIGIPFLVLFLIPFLNIGVSSSFISTIKIPEFILDFIINNKVLSILYVILVIVLIFILFRWLYSLHYFILEDCNFKEARLKSANLSRKNKIKDFLSLMLVQLLVTVFYILFVLIGIVLITLFYKIFGKVNILGNLSITIIWLLIMLSLIIVILLSSPISYATITALYYKHKEKIKEDIKHIKLDSNIKKITKKKFKGFKIAIIVLILLSATIFTYSILNNKYDFNIEYVRTMEVTAHRGASVLYPENTMAAFQGAYELGADWIELDVQQTKDGVLIILHDTNLKRTTGVSKNTWEVSYDEVKKLDAGSFFDSKFKGEKIPTLEEVIKFAKEKNIKLNIELKPTGYEKDFEKEVVSLIKKYHFEDSCVITSQVYSVLENVKKYDKNVETVYVMSLAYGDILKLKDADNFSIEASSVNSKMVKKIHNAGREIYVWTINNKDSIQRMIDLNVDNIITDNIKLAKETIYESKTSNVITEFVKFINNLLK